MEYQAERAFEIQGFKKTDADPRVLIRVSNIEYIIIVICVDDLTMFCKTKDYIKEIKIVNS